MCHCQPFERPKPYKELVKEGCQEGNFKWQQHLDPVPHDFETSQVKQVIDILNGQPILQESGLGHTPVWRQYPGGIPMYGCRN